MTDQSTNKNRVHDNQKALEACMRICYEWAYDAGIIQTIADTGYLKDAAFLQIWQSAGCHEANVEEGNQLVEIFKDYCREHHVAEPVGTAREIKVELTRHYGTISVTLGMSRYYNVHTPGQLTQAVEILTRQVEHAHRDFINTRSPGNAQQAAQSPNSATSANVVVEPIASILLTHDGKTYLPKAKGGQFMEWGVPIYEEVLRAAGLTNESFEMGENARTGFMHVQLVNGKAKRVIKLELD